MVVRVLLSVGLLLVLASAPGASAATPEDGGEVAVSMNRFVFDPEEVTVPAGTTVTWTYDDDPTDPYPNCESPQFRATDACPGHSTTARDTGPDDRPLWDSGVHRAEGFPFSHRFDTPGRYEYVCVVHGGETRNNPLTAMNGVVVVTAAAAEDGAQEPSPGPPPGPPAQAQPTLPMTGGVGAVAALVLLAAAAALRAARARPT